MVRLSFGNGQKLDDTVCDNLWRSKRTRHILKDDYGRVEVAINMENFLFIHKIKIGDTCIIEKYEPNNYTHQTHSFPSQQNRHCGVAKGLHGLG